MSAILQMPQALMSGQYIYIYIPQSVCLLEVVEGKVRHLEDLVSLTKSVVATKIMFVCFYIQ